MAHVPVGLNMEAIVVPLHLWSPVPVVEKTSLLLPVKEQVRVHANRICKKCWPEKKLFSNNLQ